MHGIFAAAQHCHILAAVEEGIADSAVADAMAFQLPEAGNGRSGAGSTGGQYDIIRLIGVGLGGDHQLLTEADAHNLVLNVVDAGTLGLGNARSHQFLGIHRLCKAVVVLDLFSLAQSTQAAADDGGLHAGTGSVQRSRYTCRSVSDDDDIAHKSVPFLVLIVLYRSREDSFRDAVTFYFLPNAGQPALRG